MNLILLNKSDFVAGTDKVRLTGRRFRHINDIHKACLGDTLTVGIENGNMGQGRVVAIDKARMDLEIHLDRQPPEPVPLNLIIAVPRPKVLNRVIISATSMGVKRIWLINAYRVEKSYWQSPKVSPENILEQTVLGLEQARDTVLPEIILKNRFKPFVEDELPLIIKDTRPIVAHPYSTTPCPVSLNRPATLVIGPEGGFIPYEIDKLIECGFSAVNLGDRILRVETAVPALIGRLFTSGPSGQ